MNQKLETGYTKYGNRGSKFECLKIRLKMMFKKDTRNSLKVQLMEEIYPNKIQNWVEIFGFQVLFKGWQNNTLCYSYDKWQNSCWGISICIFKIKYKSKGAHLETSGNELLGQWMSEVILSLTNIWD